jgi:hypothetical protein
MFMTTTSSQIENWIGTGQKSIAVAAGHNNKGCHSFQDEDGTSTHSSSFYAR